MCGYNDPFNKTFNQRSLTPTWPLTSHLLRSHVWLYPRIIVSKSHGNTSMYMDTVINFVKLQHRLPHRPTSTTHTLGKITVIPRQFLKPAVCKYPTTVNNSRGGHFHIMELRIRVNKNVEKGSDFCHRASSTFLEIRGQFSTTSTLRVSILNNEHRHLGSYFRPIRCCFRSPDFLGTDGRHLGMLCRLLQYIVMIKRVTLVCKRDLRWKRLWYESEKLRGQLANFRRHSYPIDFHTVDVFTSAIKGRYFNRIYGQIWQIYR